MKKTKIREYIKELQKEICLKQCSYEINYDTCKKCKIYVITNKIMDE